MMYKYLLYRMTANMDYNLDKRAKYYVQVDNLVHFSPFNDNYYSGYENIS